MSDTVTASANPQKEQSFGLTGSTLKIIAIISMFIDHLAVVAMGNYMQVNLPYIIMRLVIGRLAFPIFCFLLVEGLFHTRNVKKYALRLFLFAIISEIPFDLAIHGQMFYWDYQNVFFTLLIGLVVIAVLQESKKTFHGFFRFVVDCAVLVAGVLLSELISTDYGALGVLAIVFIYMFKQYRSNVLSMTVATLWLTLTNLAEACAIFDILLIKFYNGKRGLDMKYVFYIFYPAHLLLLYLVFHFILKTV